jgi:hypothetical protein
MKGILICGLCAIMGVLFGYVCAPILSVWIFQSSEPEVFAGSFLAMYKNTVVCDCLNMPPQERKEKLSRYISALQEAEEKNAARKMLSQEIALAHVRLSVAEKQLGEQVQADEQMGMARDQLASLGWTDVSSTHLAALVAQLDSEYQRVDAKGKPASAHQSSGAPRP